MYTIKNIFSQTYVFIKDEVFMPFYRLFRALIFGTEKITPFYSFDGRLSRGQFFLILLIFYEIVSGIGKLTNPIITYILCLLSLYALLAAVQKRCRDFNYNGTFWILYITIITLFRSALYTSYLPSDESVFINLLRFSHISYGPLLILLCIPSSDNPDLNLRSPLLKHPLLYIMICWIISISLILITHLFFKQ